MGSLRADQRFAEEDRRHAHLAEDVDLAAGVEHLDLLLRLLVAVALVDAELEDPVAFLVGISSLGMPSKASSSELSIRW